MPAAVVPSRVRSQDVIEVSRHPMPGLLVEPIGDFEVEAIVRSSCGSPLAGLGLGRASASSAARIWRSVEARFGGPQGSAARGDFRQWQVEVVMQDDDGPCLGLEAAEASSSWSRSLIDDMFGGRRAVESAT